MLIFTSANENEKLQDIEQKGLDAQKGFVIIEIISSVDNQPVPRASIFISTVKDGVLSTERVLSTGVDGRTEMVTLTVPEKGSSLNATNFDIPYAKYLIYVQASGFYSNTYNDFQVYTDTTSTHIIKMYPLPFGVRFSPRIFPGIPASTGP